MGKSYPDRTNATGVWKISNIYRSRTTDGTYPDHSKSRMLVHGGSTPTKQNTIDFIEIPTTGNATDFGDLTSTRTEGGSGANVSRAVFMGGGEENTIDYVHFSSQGNAADFGNKTVSLVGVAGCSNETRALSAGGYTSPADSDVIDFITIASIGNSTDFGNLSAGRYTLGGLNFDSVVVADFDESLKSVITSLLYTDVSPKNKFIITFNQWFDKSLLDEKNIQPIYYPSINKKNLKDFEKKFYDEFNEYPNYLSLLSYDLVGLIYYLSLNKDLSNSSKLFKEQNSFKGKIGIFDIKDNEINHRLNFYQVKEGKLKEIF